MFIFFFISASTPSTATKEAISIVTDSPPPKACTEADDIEKVMEDLRVLHQLSSPAKTATEPKTGSPVSVIAFNKSYAVEAESVSPPSNACAPPPPTKVSNFQDVYQMQFIRDFQMMKASQGSKTANPSPPKGNYNRCS